MSAARVRVIDQRGKNQPREYDVDGSLTAEWKAVDQYAKDCGIPPYQTGKRMSVYYARFRVERMAVQK